MAAIDKAAIAWTIAIVAVGAGFASVGDQFQSSTTPVAETQKAPPVMEQKAPPVMEQKAPPVMEQKTTTEPKMKEPTGPKTVKVSMPAGTSVPGCEETNKCYIPASVSIMKGDTVAWSNDDTAAHTVTSGTPAGGPDGMFDSSLVIAGGSFEFKFDSVGTHDYFCMVHPWMTGNVKVS